MTDDKGIIKQVDLDSKKLVRVEVSEWRGTTYFDVREWWTPEDGDPARTKKGVKVKLDDALVLIDTMVAVYNEATGSNLSLQEGG